MILKETIRSWRRALYFNTVPWSNVVANVVLHHRFSRLYMPSCIYLETTNVCNAHCIMCPHDKMQRPRGHMDERLFRKIIDQCRGFEEQEEEVRIKRDGKSRAWRCF